MPTAHASTACGAPVTTAASAEDELVPAAPADEALDAAWLAELEPEEATEDPEADADPAAPVPDVEALALPGLVDVAPPPIPD